MIMRWLIRLAFPALGILMALIFFSINNPDSSARNSSREKAAPPAVPSFEGLVPAPVPSDGPEIVFKWQDADGGWHYADQPPKQGSWNALAIEPPRSPGDGSASGANTSDGDWRSPYTAPFSLAPDYSDNES